VLFGSVSGLEAKFGGDFGPRRRHTVLGYGVLDELEDFALAGGEIFHFTFLYRYTDYLILYTGCLSIAICPVHRILAHRGVAPG
jgi:hypothetical protein